jgi:cell division protein FtsZ
MPGLINLDFADVRSVMAEMGKAMMGTGEGEGENRALEAAERAIANPLLDGVSMQGARGVIISIIGGEDMKLLELDEAANHIRELVDPDANIIWGSAFNPDLQGKIRVSVVATGIEQSAKQGQGAARPLSLGKSRGPVLPIDAEFAAEAEPLFDRKAEQAEPVAEEPVASEPYEPEPETAEEPEPLDLTVEEKPEAAEEADVLALAVEDEDDESDTAYASLSSSRSDSSEPLELGLDQTESEPEPKADEVGQDEFLLDANQLVEQNEQVTPLADGQGNAAVPAPAGDAEPEAPRGSTLFERMANLSRGTKGDQDGDGEDKDDEGSSLNIPRFLGRQNNQ